MAETLQKQETQAEETVKMPENTGTGKKKKSRRRKLVKRLIWTLVILVVLGVAGWSVYSKLRAEYKITYDPYLI